MLATLPAWVVAIRSRFPHLTTCLARQRSRGWPAAPSSTRRVSISCMRFRPSRCPPGGCLPGPARRWRDVDVEAEHVARVPCRLETPELGEGGLVEGRTGVD